MAAKVKKVKRDRRAEAKAFDRAVGARIKARRNDLGLLQRQVTDDIGISDAQLSRYESGEATTEPYMLARLAEKYGCKPSAFIDGIEV